MKIDIWGVYMRAISVGVYFKYRARARNSSSTEDDVLKVKLNCLVDATSKEHIRKVGNSTVYQFGNCVLYVMYGIIYDIRWMKENRNPSRFESNKMRLLFMQNGLNMRGNKFVQKN